MKFLALLAMIHGSAFAAIPPSMGKVLAPEKQDFILSFTGTRAGEGEIETLPVEIWHGKPAHHFRATLKTTDFIGMVYPYEQIIDIYMDRIDQAPLFVDVSIQDRRKNQHTTITLDTAKLAGEETEKSVTPGQPESFRRKLWKIIPGAQSLYSIFPFLRFKDLKVGQTITFPVAHDEKNAEFSAEVIRTETLHMQGTDREALVLKLNKSFTNVFYPNLKEEPLVWVSNDDQKQLLKFEIKHRAGKVEAKLKKPEA